METNIIYNQDCIKGMKELPDNSIDLVVTDPPYAFKDKGGGFYAENKSKQRKYLNSLREINCTEYDPIPLLRILKEKQKSFMAISFVIKL